MKRHPECIVNRLGALCREPPFKRHPLTNAAFRHTSRASNVALTDRVGLDVGAQVHGQHFRLPKLQSASKTLGCPTHAETGLEAY